MKRMTIIATVGLGLLLAGCQSNGGNNMSESNSSSDQNQTSSSSIASNQTAASELPLEDTEYGRGATSDGDDTNANQEPTRILTDDAENIIIYFSRSGNSENLARMIHNENKADLLELSVTNPYPADYEDSVNRATEERESQNYPEISTDIPDLSQYENIYLGYQTWAMTLSNPITSFLTEHGSDFAGKTIHPFSTNAGYGEGDSLNRIAELAPDATIAESFNIEDQDLKSNQAEVVAWVNQNQ